MNKQITAASAAGRLLTLLLKIGQSINGYSDGVSPMRLREVTLSVILLTCVYMEAVPTLSAKSI
ncbi:hypothetical protein ABTX34_32285 [Streptomyces sp. NPDC096538]|uniref:hypothetical protein n=1 Tax=Streptomyces sp. NPDC096538 TaxID=3155427 RepID=UPI003333EB14